MKKELHAFNYKADGNITIEYDGEVIFPVNSVLAKTMKKGEKVKVVLLVELIRLNDDAVAVSATLTNDDGDEVELFDLRADKVDMPDKAIISKDGLQELVKQIDAVFQTVQERQKKLLSLLLTIELVIKLRGKYPQKEYLEHLKGQAESIVNTVLR